MPCQEACMTPTDTIWVAGDGTATTETRRQAARRPRSLGGAFLLSLVAATCLRAFSFGTTGLDWDESLYIVIAQQWLNGAIPYNAIWDLHPMGVPALFTLATAIVGDGLLAARLAALLAVAA